MKLGNIIECNGCGAKNKLQNNESVMCCSYCGGFLEREYHAIKQSESVKDLSSKIQEEQDHKEMIDAILNDQLVRSVFIRKKSPLYIQLPVSFYNALGLKGIAAVAFGVFVLFHFK